jgi:exoribonuclease R
VKYGDWDEYELEPNGGIIALIKESPGTVEAETKSILLSLTDLPLSYLEDIHSKTDHYPSNCQEELKNLHNKIHPASVESPIKQVLIPPEEYKNRIDLTKQTAFCIGSADSLSEFQTALSVQTLQDGLVQVYILFLL